jgi:import inner membrane translocase subunit TIM23
MSLTRTALRPLSALPRAQAQALASSSSSRTLATPSTDRPSSNEALPLTWPTYLSARRSRKLWSTIASVPSTFAGLSLGGGYFASIEADPSALIMGMEPM